MNNEFRIPNMNNEIPYMNYEYEKRNTKTNNECLVDNEKHVMTPQIRNNRSLF